tara:strand:- start:31 stop:1767 length:1737 start_codon:yes stop_codon:yes gene_type:complete
MIKLLRLNKLIIFTILFILLISKINTALAAVDIWKQNKDNNQQNNQIDDQDKEVIKSPILSEDVKKITINEQEIAESERALIGLFDPEENNFNLNMWDTSDGKDIKNTFNRINKLKLSKFSEDLLFKVLFTNSYSPKSNLTLKEFNKIKIDWLIKNQRFDDLENLVMTNPEIGNETKAIKFLVHESLSNANIKSSCEKIDALGKNIKNDYLEKFKIYCLINRDRKDEAQLVFELMKERGFSEKFFEDKVNYLLGISDKTNQKILDDNLLNFYLSHITSENFDYKPTDKTNKYIWRYLSSANLIKIKDLEQEDVILTYEQAAEEDSFEKEEIFNIYLRMYFNFNQLVNAKEIHKTLPNYKARALIYQSILLSDNIERKLELTFLLKELFIKDKLRNVFSEELSNILSKIDPAEIPGNYAELVEENLHKNSKNIEKIKFDNDILHRSKVIKHFINDNEKASKTAKDFKAVFKKIKKNKKYFISIKDIVVLESLAADGVSIPENLNYDDLLSELTVPENLQNLVNENQIGLVMLKIIEIIGEDNIRDLDPETIYFLSKILNDLNLKKIRNSILSEVLPIRI